MDVCVLHVMKRGKKKNMSLDALEKPNENGDMKMVKIVYFFMKSKLFQWKI